MLTLDLVEEGASQGGEEFFVEIHLFIHELGPGHTGQRVQPITAYSRCSISYVQNLEKGSALGVS